MQIISDTGRKVIVPIGEEGSPLWVKAKFTIQLHSQVHNYIQQIIDGVKNPVITFNGSTSDNIHFVRAVKLYAERPEWL